MENKIEIFDNMEFGSIRTIQDGKNILFCGYDVAKSLGYAIPSKAVNTHCKGVSKMEVPTSGGVQRLLFIKECDVYRLIAHSKLPSAEKFENWIYEEVLPTIRKHGMYITDPLLCEIAKDPSILRNMVKNYLAATAQKEMLAAEVENMRPKAEFFDAFVSPDDCTNIRTTAKELQIPERQFCKFLVDARFLFRCPAGNLMPYNKPMNRNLFIVRDYYADNGHKGSYTLITPQGKNMFRMMLCEM